MHICIDCVMSWVTLAQHAPMAIEAAVTVTVKKAKEMKPLAKDKPVVPKGEECR